MKNLAIFSFIFIFSFVACKTTIQTDKKQEPAKINMKGEPLPDLNLRPGSTLTLNYDKDNDSTLNASELRRLDAAIEYIRVNTDYSIFFKAYMHENEAPGTAERRVKFIRARIADAGIPSNRALAGKTKPIIPQGDTDDFTPEEIVDARRVDIQIIK